MKIRSSSRPATVHRVLGNDEVEGQGLVEYSLIILLVVIAVLASVQAMANVLQTNFWDLIAALP